MGCLFDSDSEMQLCKIFVKNSLIKEPKEGKNIHIKIKRYHIDFFIKNKVFVEFHPPLKYGRTKGETVQSYYNSRRDILDSNGCADYPLIIIDRLKNIEPKISKIKKLL